MSDPYVRFILSKGIPMYKFKVTHKSLDVSTIHASDEQFADTLSLVKSWFDNGWITAWSLEGKMSDPSARV
jgi:hypothetical protein